MEDSRKQKLEGLLKAVQYIKSRAYLGTQEIFFTVKQISALHNNPVDLSDRVNQGLILTDSGYKATPERLEAIVIALDMVRTLIRESLRKTKYDQEKTTINQAILKELNLRIGNFATGGLTSYIYELCSEKEMDQASDYFSQIFSAARAQGVRTDQEFRVFLPDYLGMKFEATISSIDLEEGIKLHVQPVGEGIRILNQEVNWNIMLSRDYYESKLKERAESIYQDNINWAKVIKRLIKDREDRQKYRRQVLELYLNDPENSLRPNESYEGVSEAIDSEITRMETKVTISPETDYYQDMLKNYRYLKTIAESEKDFLSKRLRANVLGMN